MKINFEEIFSKEILGNSIQEYLIALGFFLLLLLGFYLLKKIAIKYLKKIGEKTKNGFDDFVIKVLDTIPWYFYLIIAFYFPFTVLDFSEEAEQILRGIFVIVFVLQAIKMLHAIIAYWLDHFASKAEENEDASVNGFYGMKLLVKIALWVVGIMLILSNLGFDVTSLVTSLGIGGVAIALAVQNILEDVFSSFSIYFDKPFEVGHTVRVGNVTGTVKKIGLKTTRITTLEGQELVVSNKQLTSSEVENFKKMQRRRVVFTLGVEYGTPTKKMKKIKDIIQKIVDDIEEAEFGRVHFIGFGKYTLDIEVMFYVVSREYQRCLDIREEVNFGIKDAFEKEGIIMPAPEVVVSG